MVVPRRQNTDSNSSTEVNLRDVDRRQTAVRISDMDPLKLARPSTDDARSVASPDGEFKMAAQPLNSCT